MKKIILFFLISAGSLSFTDKNSVPSKSLNSQAISFILFNDINFIKMQKVGDEKLNRLNLITKMYLKSLNGSKLNRSELVALLKNDQVLSSLSREGALYYLRLIHSNPQLRNIPSLVLSKSWKNAVSTYEKYGVFNGKLNTYNIKFKLDDCDLLYGCEQCFCIWNKDLAAADAAVNPRLETCYNEEQDNFDICDEIWEDLNYATLQDCYLDCMGWYLECSEDVWEMYGYAVEAALNSYENCKWALLPEVC